MFKRLLSVVFTVLVVFAAASCTEFDRGPVLKRADYWGKAVASCDSDRVLDCLDDYDKGSADKLRDMLDMSDLDKDTKLIMRVIAGSIQYEVDGSTLVVAEDEASAEVDIKFTVYDYERILADQSIHDAETAVKTMRKSDIRIGYVIHCKMVDTGDKWKVSEESLAELDKLYAFMDYDPDLGYSGQQLLGMVDKVELNTSNPGSNCDVNYIDYTVHFNQALRGAKLYYTVSFDGVESFRSKEKEVSGKIFSFTYSSAEGAVMDGYFLAEGTFDLAVYSAEDDTLICSDTVRITQTRVTPTPVPQQDRSKYYFLYKGVEFRLGDDMLDKTMQLFDTDADYTKLDSYSSTGGGSCYNFGSGELTIYSELQGSRDTIITIILFDETVGTPEGIHTGSTKEDVINTYGPAKDEGDMLSYKDGNTELLFVLDRDDKVDDIVYRSAYLDD